MSKTLLDVAGRPGELVANPCDVAAQLGDLAGLVREDCGDVLLTAGPQNAIPGLYAGEAQLSANGDGESQNHSTQRDDDERRQCALAQVHDRSV